MRRSLGIFTIVILGRILFAESADEVWKNTAVTDTSSITTTKKDTHASDRKRQAGTSAQRSGKGASTHAAVGASLIATGTPMMASPIIPVHIAGQILVAKGIVELAQSAADRGVQKKNKAQHDLLKKNVNQEGRQAVPKGLSAEEKSQILTPDLQKMLTDKGVNAEDFVERAAAGEFQAGEDTLRAMGNTGLDSKDLEEGQAIADTELQKQMDMNFSLDTFHEPMEKKTLAYDSSGAKAKDIEGTKDIAVSEQSPGAEGTKGMGAEAQASIDPVAGLSAIADPTKLANGSQNFNGAGSASDMNDLLAQFFGIAGEQVRPAQIQLFSRIRLERMGIMKPFAKQNIFKVAHRYYRTYGKWRRAKRLAYN